MLEFMVADITVAKTFKARLSGFTRFLAASNLKARWRGPHDAALPSKSMKQPT